MLIRKAIKIIIFIVEIFDIVISINLILHNIIAQQPVVVWVKIFLIDERQQATFLILIKVVLKGQMDILVLVVLVLVV